MYLKYFLMFGFVFSSGFAMHGTGIWAAQREAASQEMQVGPVTLEGLLQFQEDRIYLLVTYKHGEERFELTGPVADRLLLMDGTAKKRHFKIMGDLQFYRPGEGGRLFLQDFLALVNLIG